MVIGARIIKTGIAVTITMFVCKLLKLEPAFFGAVSAVINMQPSIFLTFKTSRNQIWIHVLAVVVAIIFGHLFGGNALSMGLVTMLIIVLYRRLCLSNGISTGVVAAMFILSSSPEEFLPHALNRTAVVFAGLVTAMLVNILLWPPRYSKQFKEKLEKSNKEAVYYFCTALHAYTQLGDELPEKNEAQKKLAHELTQEVRVLADFFQREGGLFASAPAGQESWFVQARQFMDYTESLVEKADRVYELLQQRYERRLEYGLPPVSSEFQAILDLLASGCDIVTRVNGKLRTVILDRTAVQVEPISEAYWEKLSKVIEEWQPKLANTYFLHALIEVAVMANEIKLSTRQAKRLLAESAESLE